MNYRPLGKTGIKVSEISLGTWQIGGDWGSKLGNQEAEKLVNLAIDNGVNFIDTADVYGMGVSERVVSNVVKSRSEEVYIATKCGRKLDPHTNASYQPDVLRNFVEDSLRNMEREYIDLIQLHCPPNDTYYRPEIFELFDRLKDEGKIRHFGISVERVEEAIKSIHYPNVETVQIIFNIFRQRPAEIFFPLARQHKIGVIVRVPLASGLLSGKFTADTKFSDNDHRQFNREGQAFDMGETFSGIDYETGVEAVDILKREVIKSDDNFAPYALKWILDFDAVSCIIPGATSIAQLESNISALELGKFSKEQLAKIQEIYEERIKPKVHQRW